MTLLDRIKYLANSRSVTLAEIERKTDLSNGIIRKWDTSYPSIDKIEKVADYFQVSTDYLLERTDDPRPVTSDPDFTWNGQPANVEEIAENVMMFGGRPLTDEKKKVIQSIIEGYLKEAGDQRCGTVTEKEIISDYKVTVITFNADLLPDELGFYDRVTQTAFLSSKLSKKERIKVLLHEIGHAEHSQSEYHYARQRCENEADRNMIHHLVKDAISTLEDKNDFDYLKFMEFYNLKTITDEIMVKEEYLSLIG